MQTNLEEKVVNVSFFVILINFLDK